MAEATSSPAGVGASNTSRRFKEELEAAKTRLSDQHFSMGTHALTEDPSHPSVDPLTIAMGLFQHHSLFLFKKQ